MNVLLVQARPEAETRNHELRCFLEQSGLHASEVTCLDTFSELPTIEHLDGVDAVVIGGSGNFLISQGDIPEIIDAVGILLREGRRRGIPMLGMCFGAQIMAHVFGGAVELIEERKETGTFQVTLLPDAQTCPVFQHMPQSFPANLGHKDHITALPQGAVNLAYSELADVQAFTFPGEPLYATTFHPELDEHALHWRLDYYAQNYGLNPETLRELKGRIAPTPDAVGVLRRFFEEIVQNKRIFGT